MRALVLLLLLCAGCAGPRNYLDELNDSRQELGLQPLSEIPQDLDAPNPFLWYHFWYSHNPQLRYAR